MDDLGHVRWRSESTLACELLVTLDGRLAVWRRPGATPVVVTRAQRSLEVPVEKPVILLHEDELSIAFRRLRVHVHGAASSATAPDFLVAPRPKRTLFRSAATAAVVGASLAAATPGVAQQGPPIEVRDQPPAPPDPEPSPDAGVDADIAPDPNDGLEDAGAEDAEGGSGDGSTVTPPIEVRDQPPVMVEVPPPAGCCSHQPGAAAASPWWRKKM